MRNSQESQKMFEYQLQSKAASLSHSNTYGKYLTL